MSRRPRYRLPLALRVFVLVLFALSMALQPVLASMGEVHELAHDPTGGHAHVDHIDTLADDFSAADDKEEGAAGTLHTLLHFAHCCGQSATLIPALQVVNAMPTAEPPLLDMQQLPLHPRTFAPYRPPIV